MFPDLSTFISKLYLMIGLFLCVMFAVGVYSGWKMPSPQFNSSGSGYSGRSSGGFWGIGK